MPRLLLLPLLGVLACSDSHMTVDAGVTGSDTSLPDANGHDGAGLDLGQPDFGQPDFGQPDFGVPDMDFPDVNPDDPRLSELAPDRLGGLCAEYQSQVGEILESFDPCFEDGLEQRTEAECNMSVMRCQMDPPPRPPLPDCDDILGDTRRCDARLSTLRVCLTTLIGQLEGYFTRTCADIDGPATPPRPESTPECASLLSQCPGYF